MEQYQVYILQSQKHRRYYTGMSSNVDVRLEFHNTGVNVSTRSGIPWERVWLSEKMDRASAVALEKKIKKRGAGRFLLDIKALIPTWSAGAKRIEQNPNPNVIITL